jgi:hypothetical protein
MSALSGWGKRPFYQYADRVTIDARPAAQSQERAWLLRALLVLQSPRTVFDALRDDSDESARARQEPVLALVGLAGIASVLGSPVAGRLLDDPAIDGLLVAVWAFIGGAFYAILGYFGGGALLHAGLRSAGGAGSYRRARHLLGFAVAPLALSLLLLWPVRLAVYGSDVFRTGGSDTGTGDRIFAGLQLGFVAWSAALLLIGVRTVHRWSWPRSLEGVAIALLVPALVLLGVRVLGS